MKPDHINAAFEGIGALLLWLNVRRLLKDRQISGVSIAPVAFYSAWGLWNLYFYPAVGQVFSAVAGLGVAVANLTWVVLAIRYTRKTP